jgi:hypothetical protein
MKKIIILLIVLAIPCIVSAQSITSISPSSASQVESVVFSIVSENTNFKSGTNTVKLVPQINSSFYINATSVLCVSDTLLKASFTFTTRINTGLYDLVVYNSQTNVSITLQKAFNLDGTVPPIPPVLVSSFPANASQGDTVEIMLKSKNTHFTQPFLTNVTLADTNYAIIPASITILNDETVKAKFIFSYFDKTGKYDIVVSNSLDGSIRLNQSFTLNTGSLPPELISIVPNSGNRLSSTLATIKGKNTFFKRDSVVVALVKGWQIFIPAEKINYLSDTVMTALFNFKEGQAAGQYDVQVFNSFNNGSLNLLNGFTIHDTLQPASLLSFDPPSARQGDSVKITVKGRKTHFLQGWGNFALKNDALAMGMSAVTNVLNDSVIEGTIFLHYLYPTVKYAVEIFNSIDGLLTLTDSFTINKGFDPPRLININPTSVTQGQKVDVLIKASRGTQFWPLGSIELANSKNTLYAKTYSLINDSTVLATFEFNRDSTALGVYDVNIPYSNSNGKLSLPGSFTINKNPATPSLVSMSPSTGTQFDTVSVMIKASGSHFLYSLPGVMMTAADNSYVSSNEVTVMNDTLLKVKFILNYNYYSATQYDLVVNTRLEGSLVFKNAFTLTKIYDHDPKITDIYPKEAVQGQSITLNIKGPKKTFLPGTNIVKLFNYNGPTIYYIFATAVNYINDSLITASFSFSDSDRIGYYYMNVANKSNLSYFNGFNLYPVPIGSKLLTVTPSWASQTDTATLVITGLNTHFDLTDNIWLESKFGTKVKPFLSKTKNDTMTTATFAFNKSNLPGVYSVNVKNVTTKNTLVLNNAFTITGSLNTTSLIEVNPKSIGCYVFFPQKIKVYGLKTHFITDADTMFIVNSSSQNAIYPSVMNILNDTIISAEFNTASNCGPYDIYVLGKENCILVGKLYASAPMSINETPREPFKIFPNPSAGIFTLELSGNFEQADLIIFDVLGKTVFSGKKLEASTQIDLSDYPAGMYFVKLIKDDVCKTEKIIKQ